VEPRGARPEHWQTVDVEELPAQRVVARGPVRPRVGTLLAATGVLFILVAGLGFLGGRAVPRPTSLAAGGVSAATPPPTPKVPAPQVTPNVGCTPISADVVPGATLQVGTRSMLGSVAVVGPPGDPPALAPGEGDLGPPSAADRFEIRSDLMSRLHTQADACALAWQIALVDDDHSIVLEAQDNPGADPGFAQQNRFELSLWPYRGGDYRLDAGLAFPNVAVLLQWQVRILPFDAPEPRLVGGGTDIPLLWGCDVTLFLFNGAEEQVNPCFGDVGGLPPSAVRLEPGAPMQFDLPDSWDFELGGVLCGQLSDSAFVPAPDGACPMDVAADGHSMTLSAPRRSGTSTLAISGCGVQRLSAAENRLCGTWYATLRVRS
jgi:hypothetical protein